MQKTEKIKIMKKECKGCELCISVCPLDIFSIAEKRNDKGYRPVEIIDKSKAQEYLSKLGIIDEDILKEDNDSENNDSSNEAPQAENVDKSITLEEKTKPSFDKIKKQAREQGEITRKWKQVMPCQHVNNSIIHVVENEVEYILFENGQEVKRLSKKNMTKQKLQTIVNKYKNFIKEQ